MTPLPVFPCPYNDKGSMPLVPCHGFVGLAYAAIGFADLHLFGFAPSWVRAPPQGLEPRLPGSEPGILPLDEGGRPARI